MLEENPYSAPTASLRDVERYTFQSPLVVGRSLALLVIVHMAATALAAGAMIHVLALLKQGIAGGGDTSQLRLALMAGGKLQVAAAGLQLLTLLGCYVVAGFWIYRVACNVRALGARGLDDSPGWAVGWYCVPVMNLFRPFRAMTQVWLGSLSPLRWQKMDTPLLLSAWWGVWAFNSVYGNIILRYGRDDHSLSGLYGQGVRELIAHLLALAASLLFLFVVRGLTAMQAREHARQMATPLPPVRSLADMMPAQL